MRCYTTNESVHVGIRPVMVAGEAGILLGEVLVPLSREWFEKIWLLDLCATNLGLSISSEMPILLSAAFTASGDVLGTPLERVDNKTLVLATAPYNENVKFTSVAFDEKKDVNGAVFRQYKTLEEATGIEVVAKSEKAVLMIMSGGSMYRAQYKSENGKDRQLQFQWRHLSRPKAELILVNERRRDKDTVTASMANLF